MSSLYSCMFSFFSLMGSLCSTLVSCTTSQQEKIAPSSITSSIHWYPCFRRGSGEAGQCLILRAMLVTVLLANILLCLMENGDPLKLHEVERHGGEDGGGGAVHALTAWGVSLFNLWICWWMKNPQLSCNKINPLTFIHFPSFLPLQYPLHLLQYPHPPPP